MSTAEEELPKIMIVQISLYAVENVADNNGDRPDISLEKVASRLFDPNRITMPMTASNELGSSARKGLQTKK